MRKPPVLHRYQSTVLGSYQTIELIETFVNYAESIKRCVCIVYDPQTSARGTLTLKAITLKDTFIKVSACCSSATKASLLSHSDRLSISCCTYGAYAGSARLAAEMPVLPRPSHPMSCRRPEEDVRLKNSEVHLTRRRV